VKRYKKILNYNIKKTAPAPTGTVNVIAPLRRKRADYYKYYSTSALLLHTQITVKELIFYAKT
jgi:hypothetical protein